VASKDPLWFKGLDLRDNLMGGWLSFHLCRGEDIVAFDLGEEGRVWAQIEECHLCQLKPQRLSVLADLRLRFAQGNEEGALTDDLAGGQKMQPYGCLAAARPATHQVRPTRNQPAVEDLIQPSNSCRYPIEQFGRHCH
jgi:hypothetical protein